MSREINCPHCKSTMFMVDAEVKHRIPIGFGFRDNSGKFIIDMIEKKGYRGACMDCRKESVVFVSKRIISRKPRSINNKIHKAGG